MGECGHDAFGSVHLVLTMAVGAVLLFLVVAARKWSGRPGKGEEPEMPTWMSAIDSFTPRRSLLLGAALSAANPKNLVLTSAAAASIAQAGLSGGQDSIAIAILCEIRPNRVATVDGRSESDGLEAIERLIAHDEIRLLASRYAVAVDSRDIDELVSLFVDDVRVGRDGDGNPLVGRDALRESFRTSLSAVGVTMLHVGTHRIDLGGPDDATGLVYCLGQVEEDGLWIHQSILYRDTYARRGGRWLFERRVHELWYGEPAPTNPLDQSPAEWPARSFGRGTVPGSFGAWAPFWDGTSGLDGEPHPTSGDESTG